MVKTGVVDVTENVTVNVTENATSLTELFAVTERTIKRDLSKLQSLGLLRHEGPDKGGRWVVLMGGNIEPASK